MTEAVDKRAANLATLKWVGEFPDASRLRMHPNTVAWLEELGFLCFVSPIEEGLAKKLSESRMVPGSFVPVTQAEIEILFSQPNSKTLRDRPITVDTECEPEVIQFFDGHRWLATVRLAGATI